MPKQYRTLKLTPFGKEVSKKLIDLDMSKSQLCKQIGIAPCYLNDILKGTRDAEERKQQIIKILNLPDSLLKEGETYEQ